MGGRSMHVWRTTSKLYILHWPRVAVADAATTSSGSSGASTASSGSRGAECAEGASASVIGVCDGCSCARGSIAWCYRRMRRLQLRQGIHCSCARGSVCDGCSCAASVIGVCDGCSCASASVIGVCDGCSCVCEAEYNACDGSFGSNDAPVFRHARKQFGSAAPDRQMLITDYFRQLPIVSYRHTWWWECEADCQKTPGAAQQHVPFQSSGLGRRPQGSHHCCEKG